jgi:hypothetical protein
LFKLKVSRSIGVGLLALALMACGRTEQFPDYSLTTVMSPPPVWQPTPDPGYYATPVPEPTATPSFAPKPPPRPPATGSAYIGSVGTGELVDPRGLAFGGGQLFVADSPRGGLLGRHGAVLSFEPATGKRLAAYESRTASTSLPADIQAVAVSTVSVPFHTAARFVYPVSARAVFGFVADRLFVLNFGAPYAPGGADAVISGDRAWVAEGEAVRAYTVPYWLPDTSTSDVVVGGAKGIGADESGEVWIAARGQIYQGATHFKPASDPPADPRDVAIDLRDGSVVVLDRSRLLRYARDGAFLGSAGSGRIADGRSVAIGDDGSVYVSDGAARAVLRFGPP